MYAKKNEFMAKNDNYTRNSSARLANNDNSNGGASSISSGCDLYDNWHPLGMENLSKNLKTKQKQWYKQNKDEQTQFTRPIQPLVV